MKKRKLRGRRLKRQKHLIIFTIIFIMVFLSTGYAAFSTKISLNAKGNIIDSPMITIEQLKQKTVENNDGLYLDSLEENRYIYRGKEPNNYIKLGDEIFRIISIENNNSLKVIKEENIGKIVYDENNSKNWEKPTTLNTFLNETYYNEISFDKTIIIDYSWPIGIITQNNEDLTEQISKEKEKTWVGKIALASVSDAIKANLNTEQCGNLSLTNANSTTCLNTNWMYNVNASWLLQTDSTFVFIIYQAGQLGRDGATRNTIYVRPSFFLKADIKLKGYGTKTTPYKIVDK